MKRIVGAAIAFALVLLSAVSAFAVEKSAGLSEQKIIEIVGALEIMQGDENGNLNLENSVTRAEFVKMAVSASPYKDDAGVKAAYSVFPDVQAGHWAAGYIRTAVDAGWIKGYLDGTFRPSGNVTLEEGVTIVLKLLGYTDADFIGSYPEGQIAKYKSLKLNTGISAETGDELTRRECMYLIYNTLCTYNKSGVPYCQTIGAAADSDGNIDYSALVEDKKEGPYIVTDLSSWMNDISATDSFVYYKDGKTVNSSDIELYDVLYYSPEFSSVWIYDDKTAGIIEGYLPDKYSPQSIVVSGVTYNIAPAGSYEGNLSDGVFSPEESVVLLFGEDGCAVEAYSASEPFAAESKAELPEGITKIYRNDIYSENNTIDERSLVYTCDTLSSAFVYNTDASGIVTSVLPSKENPETIMLGDKSYTLAKNVKELFKNQASLGENDFITVYLGSSGIVEYAEKADIYDTDIYEDNGLSYSELVSATLKGPEIVNGDTWKDKLGFDADEASYYLDGKEVDKSVIRDYDVVYYSPTFKTVWIYSDRVTGVLESILPDTVSPSSITVAGNEYQIETSQAAISFSGKGTFAAGDTVTVLIGKTGVVAAVEPGSISSEFLGLSTDVSKKEYTGGDGKTYEGYFVTVEAFDGKSYSIKTDDSNFRTGVLVYVRYDEDLLEMTVKEFSAKYTDVSEVKSAIKEGRITADAVLVDYYGKSYVKTYQSRLSQITLTEKNVAYYSINSDGYLDYLVLKDATGDIHSYGVIFNYKGNYSFLTSASNSDISSYTIPTLGVVQVKFNGAEADRLVSLTETMVTSIDGASVKYIGNSYKLWDYAECFIMNQSGYSIPKDSSDSLDDAITQTSIDYIKTLLAGDGYNVKAYLDSTGTVRVIIAYKKY